MSARGITQQEIYDEARNHLRLILPLLERIGSGSAAQVSAGYVEYDDRQERFTCMGKSTVTVAEIVAWDSATYLYADVLGKTTDKEDTRLLSDVQRLLAVTACTLKGLHVDARGRDTCLIPGRSPWSSCGMWPDIPHLTSSANLPARRRAGIMSRM